MSYASEMIDDLRDRLNDAADAQIPFATKMRFLNRGQAAMFPRIYRMVLDATLTLVDDTFEYVFPAGVGTGKVLTVEVETGSGTSRYGMLTRYDVIPGQTAPKLLLPDLYLPSEAGAHIRITSADRLIPFAATTYGAASAEAYSGAAGTEELPVLYAMGLATSRPLDERLGYDRMPTTQNTGAVSPNDLMQVSQFWLGQFELLLDRLAMPYPVSRN